MKLTTWLKDNYNHSAPVKKTGVTLYFEDEGLKLLFICQDSAIISKGKSYNDKLYEGDTVELFLTLGEKERYLELEVNPDGVEYAVVVKHSGKEMDITPLEEPPFFTNTVKTGEGWMTSWEIPLAKLEKLGFDRNNAYFNIFRQDYDGGRLNLYALSPTGKDTFHDIQSFIKLDL